MDEVWRLFRQILEGLTHIHAHGIIHRDLKPDNIFIDQSNNPRIGDFGLATSSQFNVNTQKYSGSAVDSDLTTDVGTAMYVAPELNASGKGQYNDKVDMYSLGVILFEMCYALKTAMERDFVIRALKSKEHTFPEEFDFDAKAPAGDVIKSLLNLSPNARPSSGDLLLGGKLPLKVEDETIRLALQGITDADSPYYQKVMSSLFSQPVKQVKEFTWDIGTESLGPNDLLLQGQVKEKLISIFRVHGAVEATRPLLFPRSPYYASNVAQYLDPSGTLLQLPYDLTLPYARIIARQIPATRKSFAFGNVYRDLGAGGEPGSHGEVDFDIVSTDSLDLALKEAEVIKVLDEVVDSFPPLKAVQMCFHVNHSDLLELIMEFCEISRPQRPLVKEVLSKLNTGGFNWQKIRNELRSPAIGIPSTSLDDLVRFDFRDTQDKAFQQLRALFGDSEAGQRCAPIFSHLSSVIGYLRAFGVRRKIYFSPLSNFNDKFYSGGLVFQCLYDNKRREVFAAGGRYDRLIRQHRPRSQGVPGECHAVGFNLAWESLFFAMAEYKKDFEKKSFLKKVDNDSNERWLNPRVGLKNVLHAYY
jgi:translation initiation factor 2-alpha kinase 4